MIATTRKNLAALALAAGTTFGAWSRTCPAQPEQPKAGEFAKMRVPSAPISINFRGGFLAEYVKVVQDQRTDNAWPINVILGPRTDQIVVRPIELKFVSVDTAMETLVYAVECPPGELRIDRVNAHDDESPTFSIVRKDTGRPSGANELEVVSIAQLTRPSVDGVSRADLAIEPDVVLSAVELALPAGDEPARVRYHEESQLLILQGSLRATNAVQRVINTMINDQRQRLGDAGRSQKDMIEARARVERTQIRVKTAEDAVSRMRIELDRTAALAAKGTASSGEVEAARANCTMSENALLDAQADFKEATALAALIESKWTPGPSGNPSDELTSLRKLVEDQTAQIKALTEELAALRKSKNTK